MSTTYQESGHSGCTVSKPFPALTESVDIFKNHVSFKLAKHFLSKPNFQIVLYMFQYNNIMAIVILETVWRL